MPSGACRTTMDSTRFMWRLLFVTKVLEARAARHGVAPFSCPSATCVFISQGGFILQTKRRDYIPRFHATRFMANKHTVHALTELLGFNALARHAAPLKGFSITCCTTMAFMQGRFTKINSQLSHFITSPSWQPEAPDTGRSIVWAFSAFFVSGILHTVFKTGCPLKPRPIAHPTGNRSQSRRLQLTARARGLFV